MRATVEMFRDKFATVTAFAALPDSDIQSALEEATDIHGARVVATLYVAAHLLTLSADTTAAGDSGAGEVSVEQIGTERVEYKTMADAGWQTFFSTTSYGRRFLLLEQRTPGVAMSARVYG